MLTSSWLGELSSVSTKSDCTDGGMRCRTLLPLALACATAFPQSGDPITADPPAAPADAEPCDVVTLFENATCSGYNLVLRRPWGGAPSA